MQRDDNSRSPAKSLVDAQRKLLNRLRATRVALRESEMGRLEATNESAWSNTEWADTAGPAEDPDLARSRVG